MNFIKTHDRNQMEILSLESLIGQENFVRLMDAFVEKLELERLGFVFAQQTGFENASNANRIVAGNFVEQNGQTRRRSVVFSKQLSVSSL